MQVFIDSATIELCKQEIQEYYGEKAFKEVGGYILGNFDGEDFHVKSFYLDKYAESSSITIKLSVEAFHEVEQIRTNSPDLMYLGTWHVHPGMDKPAYSHVDVSTLFLERIIIDSDNPENLDCPKIHIIFNNSLTAHSCYTMDIKFEFLCEALDSSIAKNIIETELLDIGLDSLKESKDLLKQGSLENFIQIQKNIEEIYNNLDLISDQLNFALDFFNELNWYKKVENRIEKIIRDAIKNGEKIGVISSENEKKIDNLKYRPKNIRNSFDEGILVGFWVLFPYERISDMFLKIFYANFFKKIKTEPGDVFLFFLVQKINNEIIIKPYFLNFTKFEGISYIELETILIEEDINENNVSEP
ncbi:MAG: hypothetical protein ACFFCM_11235 [Promethearchaeota archaeon]